MNRAWRLVVGGLAVLAFALLVWPTLWSKGVVKGNSVRASRLTGCTQVLTNDGWWNSDTRERCLSAQERRDNAASAAARQAQEQAEVQRIADEAPRYEQGKAALIQQLNSHARLSISTVFNQANVELYNPTGCIINGVTITLNGREYGNKSSENFGGAFLVEPQNTASFKFNIFDAEAAVESWSILDLSYASPQPNGESRRGDPSCVGPDW